MLTSCTPQPTVRHFQQSWVPVGRAAAAGYRVAPAVVATRRPPPMWAAVWCRCLEELKRAVALLLVVVIVTSVTLMPLTA